MASQCCVCAKKIGLFGSCFPFVEECSDQVLCDDCHAMLMRLRTTGDLEEYTQMQAYFCAYLSDEKTPDAVKGYFARIDQEKAAKHKAMQEKQEAERQYNRNLMDMMLTTGPNFEGYRVAKYLDIVCEEVLFKNGFLNRLSAGFEDLGGTLTLKETELSGSSELISRARAYVTDKFRRKAAALGANAVLAVEYESSFGSDIVRVAIFGTAVVIEKL